MRHEKAFAMIAVITLLCLVAVVCLGLLSLSSLSLRGSNASAAQVSAQANARLAMLLALDRLQKYTGPDQRVTATAELTVPPNRYSDSNLKWTGVWATTQPTDPNQALSTTNPPDPTKPVVTGAADPTYPDRKYLSDYRSKPGYAQKSLMLAWLVSGDPSPSAMPTSPTATASHITLVEKAAGLADPSAADPLGDRVTAPLVKINPGTSQAGGYAFWIGDESLKARIDQKPSDNQPDLNDPNNGGMTRLAGGEGPNVRFVQAGAATKPYGPLQDAKGADRAKLISRESVGLLLPGSNGLHKKNFHDLTTYSESVLADVRDGGLKKDLTSYISQTTSPPAIANIPETGLANDTSDPTAPGRAILPGPLYAKFGPNYLQLRNWYNLRKKVTGGVGSGAMDPVFLKTRNSVAAWGISWGAMPDLKSREQSVQPLIAEARIAFDFSLDQGRGGGMAIRTHAYPLVKLWNPYNVTLKARRYLVGFPRYIYLSAAGYTVKAISTKPAPPRGTLRYFGDAEGDALYFTLEAVDLAPGECLYFSPKTSGESDKYDPTNIAANVLSPSVPAGGTENFHFDADVMIQGPAYNPATPIQYGISNWPMRNYFLKDAGTSSAPITSADAQSSSSYPIIQKLAMDSAGDGSSSSPVGNPFPNPGGTSAVPLRTSTTHAGTVPLYSWYMGARLRRFDENLNEQVGGYGGTPGRFPLRNPLLSAFNVRPQILHRCNFCTQYDWFWWTVGAYINSRADQVITDTATMSGRMVNGKCLTSPFGTTADYGSAKSFALFEVPRTELPPASLANFQHAQLGYQSWQPTYIVGHSFANGRSDRNAMVNAKVVDPSAPLPYYEHQKTFDEWDGSFKARYGTGNWYDLTQYTPGTPRELLIYDSCYAVNYALWDRYFLSTIPFDNNGSATLPTNSARMSNPAMMLSSYSSKSPATVRSLLEGPNSFDYASCFLMNQGGFNINSTSVEAWRAFFSSMNDVQRPARDGSGTVATAFSRLLLPGCTTQATNHCAAGAWDGAKSLTEDEINRMAVAMVKNVKLRGPFLGLADFVNRRLTSTQFNGGAVVANSLVADPTMCGPLQAAIEESATNKNLQQTTQAPVDTVDPNPSSGGWWSNDRNHRNFWPDGNLFGPWRGQNAPGYLTQADILQGAGANITARGDTFVIRAYGDKRDASGNVIARAWCEAVVQRTPDYLAAKSIEEPSDNTGNNPMEPMVIRSTTEYGSTLNPKLNAINKKFGRRYVIKGFRWLNASEV